MGIALANNAHTTLAANISSTDTTIYVDDVDTFPTLGVGDYFYCTLESVTGTYEIVKVTQVNATNFIVVRGQENTIPISFPIGSLVELRMTVQNITDLILTGNNIDDTAYSADWNGDTDDAPSRNAVYDKIETLAPLANPNFTSIVRAYNTAGQTAGHIWANSTEASDVRWAMLKNTTAESGANAGSNLDLYTYTDGGSLNDRVFRITRSTGIVDFSYTPTVSGSAVLLSSAIGSTVQAYDADLATWAGLTPSANAQSLVTAADYAAMRSLLGLVIGTNVQAYDADLTTLGAGGSSARSFLGLAIGTDVQAYSSVLNTLSSEIITSASDTIYLGKQTGASNHYWGIKIDNTAPALGGFVWNLEGTDQWRLSMNYAGTMFLFNPVLASSVYTISPSTNVMAFAVTPTVQDDAYAAGWNGSTEVPTKNAIYDKIESLSFGSGDLLAANNLSELTATASTARSNLGLAIGTDVQAYDADLASWAAVTRAAGFDTFVATPSSVNLKSLVTDETGSGSLVFATSPTLVTPALGVATATSIQGPPKISSETTGALTSTSRNCIVQCSGNITLPASGMSDGDSILIDPRGTARTITRPAAHTMYIANTDSATGTTGAHNVVTAVYHGSSKWTVQGSVS